MNNQDDDRVKNQTLKLIGIAASSIFLAGSMPIIIGLVNMRERISMIEQEQISTHDVISLFKKQVDLDAEIVKITADIHAIQELQNKSYAWIDKLAVIEERQTVVREQLRNLEEDVRNLENRLAQPRSRSRSPPYEKSGSMTTNFFKLAANDLFKWPLLMIERMKL